VEKRTSTFHDFPYATPQRKCIHCWIVNVTPPGFDHCIHRCSYCYARDAVFSRPSTGTLEVYDNLPELVERDLDRIALCPPISISNTTDPCQDVPEVQRQTARLVHLLVGRGPSFFIVTKGDATFLLDVPGFAQRERVMVATTIEGPPEVLELLSPRAPNFQERLGSVRRLAAAGVRCVVRLDPVFPHVYRGLYGSGWRDRLEKLLDGFAAAGAGHVICSTGRLSRRKGPGAPGPPALERMAALAESLDAGLGRELRRDYRFDRSGTSAGYLWRRAQRLAFHRWLRGACEARGLTYATCQETTARETDSQTVTTCEGTWLPFCVKGLDGRFEPIQGCTALCHVTCRERARPPCGRRSLVTPQPLRISQLR
jgi:DNA repair photolyase